MRLTNASADLYVPDALPMPEALSRTTHLCVGAHQDDQELMAFIRYFPDGIQCFHKRTMLG